MSHLADFGPLKEFIPDGLLDSLGLGRAEECIQPLIDLGYLNRADYTPRVAEVAMTRDGISGKASKLFGQKMAKALNLFRQEANDAGLLHECFFGLDLKEGEDAACVPGTVELDLLHRLVSLDGETELEDVPVIGSLNLDSRILHYQLQILGLYEGDPGAPLSEAGMKGIWQLETWLGIDSETEILPFLGDIGELSNTIAKKLGARQLDHAVAYFKEPFKTMTGLGTKPRAFLKELERVVPEEHAAGFFALVDPKRGRMIRRLRDSRVVGQLTRDPFNRFLLRLVQVRQWMRGFYQGKLDFWFGPKSLRSLKGYAEALDFEVGELVVRAGKDDSGGEYWAMNMAALLNRIREEEEAEGELPADGAISQFEDHFDQLNEDEQAEVVSQLNKGTADHHKDHQKGLGLGRRIYLGVKSMALSIKSGFKMLVKWIKNGVAKLVNLGKNLFRLISRQLREGLRSFGSGISFLFSGKETVSQTRSGKEIVSDFSFDFDFALAAPTRVKAKELETHLELVGNSVHNLNFCLRLTGAVLHWVTQLLQGPIGWLKLALRVAKTLRKMLVRRLRKRASHVSRLGIRALV